MISIYSYFDDFYYNEFYPHYLLTHKYNYDSDYPINFLDQVNEMLRMDKYPRNILVYVLMHQMNLYMDLMLMFFLCLHSIFHDALLIYSHSQYLLIDVQYFDFVQRLDDDLKKDTKKNRFYCYQGTVGIRGSWGEREVKALTVSRVRW